MDEKELHHRHPPVVIDQTVTVTLPLHVGQVIAQMKALNGATGWKITSVTSKPLPIEKSLRNSQHPEEKL